MAYFNYNVPAVKHMTKFYLLTALLILPFSAVAQSHHEPKEVLLNSNASTGGFMGLNIQQTDLFGQSVNLTGGQGAWHINQWLLLGIQAQSLTSRVQNEVPRADSLNLTTYGLYAEVNLYTWRFLSARASTSLGAGHAGYRVSGDETQKSRYDSSGLTYREISAHILLHLFEYADLGLGYGSASMNGISLKGVKTRNSKHAPLSMSLRKVF